MKTVILIIGMVIALDSFGTIEHTENKGAKPSASEVQSNRYCFQELLRLGCGDPGDDIQHFRACMNNVFSDLPKNCQKLMLDLYK